MLKKEYEAADSLARVIRDAVSDGEQFRRASAVASASVWLYRVLAVQRTGCAGASPVIQLTRQAVRVSV